jgi:1-acyl-sn-glycerol-3-phosphate acyltransferase
MSTKRDAYHWRILATGLSFVVFGVGCLCVGLVLLPLARVLPGAASVRAARMRRTVGTAMRWFAAFTRWVGGATYEFQGAGRLGRPGQLIVVNHPSLADVVYLLGYTPSSICIVKEALWRNPFTRWSVAGAGYVSNAPTQLMIEQAADALRSGQSVIIFPEGTRTVPGQPLHFHRGAAAIAIRAASVVTPVFIRCEPPTLAKGQPWYRVPVKRVHFSLRAGADIDPEPFRRAAAAPLAGRQLNAHLLRVFTTELTCSVAASD